MSNQETGTSGVLRFNDGNNILMYHINNYGDDIFMKINLDGKEALLDGFDIYNLGEACKEAIDCIKKTKTVEVESS